MLGQLTAGTFESSHCLYQRAAIERRALVGMVGMVGGHLIAARLAGPHLQKGFAVVSMVVAVALLVKSYLVMHISHPLQGPSKPRL